METSLMRHCKAIAARPANSTALRFNTGKAPGSPRHTGHTFVFGGSPNRVEQEQKIFDSVNSCTWTSSPMTGSYFARRSSETAGVVAISEDYSLADGFITPSVLEPLHLRRTQILFHRDFEIHQLIAFRVAHPHEVEAGAGQRIRNVSDIEKQETPHRGVRFDRLCAKLSLLNFVPCLAAHAALDLFSRQRNRQGIRPVIARRMRESAHEIVGSRGIKLAAIFGIQLRLHADERDGLIAVIRDDEE